MKRDEEKPFLEHLEDLRWVIIKSLIALVSGSLLCFIETKPVMAILLKPLKASGEDPQKVLRVLGVVDPLSVQLQISLLGGLVLSLPFILYFVAQFIIPGLTPAEVKLLFPIFSCGAILFIGGILFCYFILLPQTLQFFSAYNKWMGIQTDWTLQNYSNFVVQMLVSFGLAFELPLVVILLGILGIINSATLSRYRRHAIVVIVIAAACITPTSDPLTLFLLSVPMYLLYEGSLWVLKTIENRKRVQKDHSPELLP
ncbi:twin-arginine translocase subunit TatC [Methylacidiphilum caldifontis]|uniref:Sec-independent protein translocase protein TatC n=1 Tax=Methylacidiphilum caldifontis TaxID=2795386 RepID=A0A4Y8P9R2_9BACT|nr:twin-arginine translocase subunit TatC [Methylacidiphilum caldifontis]TFE67463.1 twin arginine-targeting protein translocase TatC [Methylacidiphilum caldifontis]